MAERVCPWWIGMILASPIRRWFQNPEGLLGPYVREGMTVLEPGPGMGFFTLPLARMVGPSGRVIAVDLQPAMLEGLRRRAKRAGLLARMDLRLAQPDTLGIGDLRAKVDLVVAIAVVHEMPSEDAFFRQAAESLKPDGRLLLIEPGGHVQSAKFNSEIHAAGEAGLAVRQGGIQGHKFTATFRKVA